MKKLSNISVAELRKVLSKIGLKEDGGRGGHERWVRPGMKRPVVFPTHTEPVAEFIVRNILRNIGMSKDEFLAYLDNI